jgi:hypothetical protein
MGAGSIPGWTVGAGAVAGEFDPSGYFSPVAGTPPSPPNVAWANPGNSFSQLITAQTITQGLTYLLTVDVGSRNDQNAPAPIVDLTIGNTLVATGFGTFPAQGGYSVYTATFTAPAGDAGDNLTILLGNGDGAGGQALFDNVELGVTPEPSLIIPAGIGFGILMIFLRKRAIN